MSKALLVIDLQNDYFEGGHYALWNTEDVRAHVERAIASARDKGVAVLLVQHVVDPAMGKAPFFNEGTEGVEIHPRIRAAAPGAPVIVKTHADSFEQTTLEQTLGELGVTELVVCGMMTHNCVTHTAISRAADKYQVSVAVDCCTTVDEILHELALHALSTRVALAPARDLL